MRNLIIGLVVVAGLAVAGLVFWPTDASCQSGCVGRCKWSTHCGSGCYCIGGGFYDIGYCVGRGR